MTSLILFASGVFCYTISQLAIHGKLSKRDVGFWSAQGYNRKYRLPKRPPLGNAYYKLFEIPYKERFPLSATALVLVTDSYHLFQFFCWKFVILSIVFYVPVYTWFWDGGIFLGVWYIVFNSTYKVFGR